MSGSNASGHSGISVLPYVVVRIRAGDPTNPSSHHTGTGFFYMLRHEGAEIPLIVSNKHVLCGKTWMAFDFGLEDANAKRILGPGQTVRINQGQLPIVEHPDPNVDLAAVPFAPLRQSLIDSGLAPHAVFVDKSTFAPPHMEDILQATTSVLMAGFPNGIMDETNNLPVVRRGSLAMFYKADYQGQTNFVVDIAAFGGSSGSPVFAFFEGMSPDGQGNIGLFTEPRIYLIGVLHSGPTMTANGMIVQIPVPTTHYAAQTSVMIHLGYCLKAHRIEELITPLIPLLVSR